MFLSHLFVAVIRLTLVARAAAAAEPQKPRLRRGPAGLLDYLTVVDDAGRRPSSAPEKNFEVRVVICNVYCLTR